MAEITLIALCLLLNALFAGVEMAFVTVTKPRLRELAKSGRTGSREAKRVLALRENPERTLSVIQVGITVVGAVAAALGGVGASSTVAPYIGERFDLSPELAEGLAVMMVVIPITFINVVFGELVPKTLALRNPLAIVLRAGRWLVLMDRLLRPAVWVLEMTTRAILRLISRRARIQEESSPGESVELDLLSKQTREYVLNLVDLENKRIRDVKLPWENVVFIREGMSADEVERNVLESGHTRLPVLAAETDEAIGLLNTKEFIVFKASGGADWRSLVRAVIRVEESSPILRALRRMQEQRSHLSITYKNGQRTGIVTMEDIFEEVIGDVFDEDDDGALRKVLSSSPRFRRFRPARG